MWYFKNVLGFVKKPSGFQIKVLRISRGAEYMVCDDFLMKNDIKH